MKKRWKYAVISSLAGVLALSACTPAQIATFERLSRTDVPRSVERDLLQAPDQDWITQWGIIKPDGSVDRIVAPAGSKCPQYYDEALLAGWPAQDWYKLDAVIYRESRCNPGVYNGIGLDNSYGLIQLNMKAHKSWVGPLVGWDFTKLYDPQTNLWVGRRLYDRAQSAYGCGWQPWVMC